MRRSHVDTSVLDAVREGTLALPTAARHRFVRILRLPPGDVVEVFDGAGRVARGCLTADGDLTDVTVDVRSDGLPPLVVAQAVVAADKLESVVKKGTELGASGFILFESARGQVHLGDRAEKRRNRLARLAEDATRQCGRAGVPSVEGPIPLAALVERVRAFSGLCAMGVVDANEPLSEALAVAEAGGGMFVVVGPEGGLDRAEQAALTEAGARPVRLGACVLRTETAALAALACAQVRLGYL